MTKLLVAALTLLASLGGSALAADFDAAAAHDGFINAFNNRSQATSGSCRCWPGRISRLHSTTASSQGHRTSFI
jgi:hypothetical protein